MQTSYFSVGLRNDFIMWIAIGLITGALFTLFLAPPLGLTESQVDCQEDEAWIAVDYRDLDGFEDSHGVTRACRSVDQLIDYAFEVAIQEGVLMYVPNEED